MNYEMYGRLLVLIFSLVVPAIFDPIAYLYLFSQQMNIHTYMYTQYYNRLKI